MPPKGTSGNASAKLLIDIMPVSTAAPIAVAVLADLVNVEDARPNGNRLASSAASSNLENGEISASGAKGSSFIARADFGTSVMTVGSKKYTLLQTRLPPVDT